MMMNEMRNEWDWDRTGGIDVRVTCSLYSRPLKAREVFGV